MGKTGVAYYRKAKNLTQADVAKRLGVSGVVMGFMESGDFIPTAAQVEALVQLLEVPPTYLFSKNVLAEVTERAQAEAAVT